MESLRSLIVDDNNDIEGLKSEGFVLVESRENYSETDNCESYVMRFLIKEMPTLDGLDSHTVMERIEMRVKSKSIITYNEIPRDRVPEDFVVMYLNANIRSFIEYDEFDDTVPINMIPFVTHWAKVVRIEEGGIIVTSKMVYKDVFEHVVNNQTLLNLFCKGDFYYFIDILTIKKSLMSEM